MRKESARLLSQLSQLSFEELGGRLKIPQKRNFYRFDFTLRIIAI